MINPLPKPRPIPSPVDWTKCGLVHSYGLPGEVGKDGVPMRMSKRGRKPQPIEGLDKSN